MEHAKVGIQDGVSSIRNWRDASELTAAAVAVKNVKIGIQIIFVFYFEYLLQQILYNKSLKAVDTIGNCLRLAFIVGVSQHIHKITNLWKF